MEFKNQQAQIRAEESGCTVIHLGSTYPPSKVSFSCKGTGVIIDDLPPGKYLDAIISGTLNSKKEELTVTALHIC